MQSLYFVFKEHRINIIWHRRHVIIWKLGGGVDQRHCQLLEKKNVTFEASNKEIEIASCTVENNWKSKRSLKIPRNGLKGKKYFSMGIICSVEALIGIAFEKRILLIIKLGC